MSGMITSAVNGGVGGLAGAATAGEQATPPVEMAMAPTAVILMLMGEENMTLASDSHRGASLDVRL